MCSSDLKFFLLHVSYPPTQLISKYQLFFWTYRSIHAEDLRYLETINIMLEITHESTQDACKNYKSRIFWVIDSLFYLSQPCLLSVQKDSFGKAMVEKFFALEIPHGPTQYIPHIVLFPKKNTAYKT